MSKIAAYLGSSLSLAGFFANPENSLFRQSMSPDDDQDAGIMTGGFGIGWYNPGPSTASYINPLPCWRDTNLPSLLNTIRRRMWLGYLHGDIHQYGPGPENMQPLRDGEVLFAHSGSIDNFLFTLRPYCLRYLDPEIEADIAGQSESEYLFALLRQRMTENDNVSAEVALAEISATLEVTLRDIKAGLNIIVGDGIRLFAVRHATHQACDPLYYCEDDPSFPPGSQLISSTPLSSQGQWKEIPEHHLLTLDPERPPELVRL